ncbi:MAG: TolB-like protein [Rhodothermales bacterium]
MSFFEELKRRNVFRVGIAYGVASWVLLQIADLVVDNIVAPDWVMPMLMLLVGLGFVAALIIAWAYEMTADGIKREADVDRSDSATHHTAKKLDFITLGAVGLLIVLLLADRFMPADEVEQTPVQTVDSNQPATKTSEPDVAEPSALERGVAVLPFANMSEDPNNAFFAGGVHEDILTNLSRIADLRVISRTSMLRIAEKGLDIRQIGQQLGVSHVLEGSVRRAGDQVRVTVQLIDASNDNHLWADNFDRKLDDVFAIQSEIAQKIASQLEIELSPEQAQLLAEVPTSNTQAYDLYLKAREIGQSWLGADGFKQMRPMLEQAVVLDPDFLDAQVDLAEVYGRLVWTGSDPDGIYLENARTITQRILQNWPDRPQSDIAQGNYHYTVERDYQKALVSYEKALISLPNNVDLLIAISSSHKRLNQYESGLPVIRRAASLDPESPVIAGELGFHLVGTGQFDLAMEHFRKTVERFPADLSAKNSLAGFALTLEGDKDEYLKQVRTIEAIDPSWVLFGRQAVRMLMNPADPDQRIDIIEAYKKEKGFWEVAALDTNIAELLNLVGREQESQQRASATLLSIEDWLASGQTLAGNTPGSDYAWFAYLACLANDHAGFETYSAKVNSLPEGEGGNSALSRLAIAEATAECGDVNAGWELWKENPGAMFSGVSPWILALDPLYQHYYSDIPEYQEMVGSLQHNGDR